MARTLADIVELARSILQDQRAPYRYNDLELCRFVGEAVSEARRQRPDLFVYSLDEDLPLYTNADLQRAVPLPSFMLTPLVNYVAGRAEMRDDTFTTDGRAVTLLGLFTASLKGS